MSFVQIEVVAVEIRGEHHLRQTVAVEITGRDATAVVKVAVGENVEVLRPFHAIREPDSRIARWHEGEELAAHRRRC